jgi:hypothetical protein
MVINKMKGFCYIALIIGFFIFYQQNPLYAIIIIVLFIGVYLFFKSRKATEGGIFSFFSGRQMQNNTQIDDFITLMMLQQLMNSNGNRERPINEKEQKRKSNIDRIKKEVIDLLDEE